MKEIEGEKKEEWKKDLIADEVFVSKVNALMSVTSLPLLTLHYSNKSVLTNSSLFRFFGRNSINHIGNDGTESLIIDKDFRSVCRFSDCALIHDRFHYCL